MTNIIFYQLSLKFFSDYLGVDRFNLISSNLRFLKENLGIEEKSLDINLAVEIFVQILEDGALNNHKLLYKLFNSLPPITQKSILSKGNCTTFNCLLSDFLILKKIFIEDYKIDARFFYNYKTEINEVHNTIVFDKPENIFKKLKDYQSELFFEVKEYIFNTPYSRAIIQMPTGSGKTRTAMELVCDYLNEFKKDVIWIANTEELCDQAFNSFNEVWPFNRQIKAGSINLIREKKIIKCGVPYLNILSVQSLRKIKNENELFNKFKISKENIGLVIIDEAHISVAPTYLKSILFLLSGYDVRLIGLTATPGKELINSESEINKNKQLSDFYFNKIFKMRFQDEQPLEYLTNKGILSKAKYTSIEGSVYEIALSESEILKINEKDLYPKRFIDFLTKDKNRNFEIFNQIKKRCELGKKILFFATSIDHSILINTLLNNIGIASQHIDSSIGKNRKLVIENFKKNKLQVLCNYGVLSTGFDDPKIDVVFIARKTSSIVLYSQMIGRGLRGPKIGGTMNVEIVSVEDNLVSLPQNNEIYEYFNGYYY